MMRLRKDLIKPPKLNLEEEEERHANWLELLFDLIFVAALSVLALELNYNYSFNTFLLSVPLFFAIWWGWVGHTIYLSRFGTDDVIHRFFTLFQMIVVALMAINSKNALNTTGSGFALSYALLRFMLVAEYILAGRSVPEARPLTRHYSIGFSIAAFIWVISAFVPDPWRYILWIIAIIVDIATPLIAGKFQKQLPLHPTHLPERFGLLTIILIGETIVSVVYVVGTIGLNFGNGVICVMGILIAFSIWWGYFEESRGAEARIQDKKAQIGNYQLWLYSHFPLLLGIIATSTGIKHLIYLNFGDYLNPSEVWLMCFSLALAFISLSLIFLSSFRWQECISKLLIYFRFPYYLIIIMILFTGFLGEIIPGYMILVVLTVLCCFKIVLSFREIPEDITCSI